MSSIKFPLIVTNDLLKFLSQSEIAKFRVVAKTVNTLVFARGIMRTVATYGIRSSNYLDRKATVPMKFYPGEESFYLPEFFNFSYPNIHSLSCKEIKQTVDLVTTIQLIRMLRTFLATDSLELHCFILRLPSHYFEKFGTQILVEKDVKYRSKLISRLLINMYQIGNCGEYTTVTLLLLKEHFPNVKASKLSAKTEPSKIPKNRSDGTHVVVLIDTEPHVIVCDIWAQNVYLLEASPYCMNLVFLDQNWRPFRHKFNRHINTISVENF